MYSVYRQDNENRDIMYSVYGRDNKNSDIMYSVYRRDNKKSRSDSHTICCDISYNFSMNELCTGG